ncbi:MAG TPA: DUF4352 domain-containing protein [Mycobacteriales bacterium]|jgi:hypothetical protein|nr:DUF4352 domain-containing protein [Mycobacteriales bacterium]
MSNPGYNPRDAKAQAKADKAYSKAQRPLYKKKRVLIPAGIVGLGVIAAIAGGGGSADDTSTTEAGSAASTVASAAPGSAPAASSAAAPAAPAYAGALKGDKAGAPGASLMLSGWTVTASPLAKQPAAYSGASPTVCTAVTLVNRDDVAQSYNIFSWKIQDSAGGLKNSSFGGDNLLSSGEVAPGGQASGNACFDAPAATGQTLVVWEPDLSSKDRAVWINAT